MLEDAALELFRQRGFHGVGLREIADRANLSLGNIYNYYQGKEPLFAAIVDRLYAEFTAATVPLARFLADCRFPEDLQELGQVMGQMVSEHRDYLLIVFIDTAEFGGKHVRPHYENLAVRFRAALGPRADALHQDGLLADWADPAVAFALAYMQFSSYFIVERLIGARNHLGLDDGAAVDSIARLFTLGLAPRDPQGVNHD